MARFSSKDALQMILDSEEVVSSEEDCNSDYKRQHFEERIPPRTQFRKLKDLPTVEAVNITNYLVLQTSYCTRQQMKAYKSLEAYNFFVSGYGCKHEAQARGVYEKLMGRDHAGISCMDSALWLNPKWPYMGSSPDGIVVCDCHGTGICEIKGSGTTTTPPVLNIIIIIIIIIIRAKQQGSAPLSDRDRHVICALCLGPDHAALALSSGGCELCEELPMSTLRARLALFDAPAVSPSASTGPRKKKRRSQRPPEPAAAAEGSPEPLPRASLSPSPPPFPDAQRPAYARTAVASGDEADHAAISDSCSLLASDSEEWSGSHRSASSTQESSRSRASVDAELLRLLTKAVEQLGLDWSPPKAPAPNRLDGCFLPSRRQAPASRSAPFLPELHTELSKSWNAPFSARLTAHRSLRLSPKWTEPPRRDTQKFPRLRKLWQRTFARHPPDGAQSLPCRPRPAGPHKLSSAAPLLPPARLLPPCTPWLCSRFSRPISSASWTRKARIAHRHRKAPLVDNGGYERI
ncbi:unnamed protein product [Leuciscus chuanchicus]